MCNVLGLNNLPGWYLGHQDKLLKFEISVWGS
jgi:hypothetical protein